MNTTIDRTALLSKLDPIEPGGNASQDAKWINRISLASALLTLAEIDHEHEYQLCYTVAKHLLGSVPEPDDQYLGE